MKVCLPGLVLLITVGWAAVSRAADDPTAIAIWPGKTPQETGQFEDKTTGEAPRRRVESVATPTITVFRPEKEKNTGAAMLIAPGGGYNFLSWDHEGVGVARWLNSLGMTGVVLKYRVPRRPDQSREAPTFGPLQDAQRAMSLVRSKAREWEIDPQRIGMIGFSAGGHLAALTMTNFDRRGYDPIDAVDQVSSRPDFAVLIYPGGIRPRGSDQLIPDIRVTSETPPAFLVHAHDDPGSSEQSVLMYLSSGPAAEGVPQQWEQCSRSDQDVQRLWLRHVQPQETSAIHCAAKPAMQSIVMELAE